MRGGRDWLIHRMDVPVDPRRGPVPIGVTPMRASPGPLPEDDGWAYERRWNGIRATALELDCVAMIVPTTSVAVSATRSWVRSPDLIISPSMSSRRAFPRPRRADCRR